MENTTPRWLTGRLASGMGKVVSLRGQIREMDDCWERGIAYK
jgi:hypothetical protein